MLDKIFMHIGLKYFIQAIKQRVIAHIFFLGMLLLFLIPTGFSGPAIGYDEQTCFSEDFSDLEFAEKEIPFSFGGGYITRVGVPDTEIKLGPSPLVDSYVVKGGDTWSGIAESLGVDTKTLRYANPDINTLRPGQELRVLPVSGMLYEVAENETIDDLAEKMGVEKKALLEANDLVVAADVQSGKEVIVPGVYPTPSPTPSPVPQYAQRHTVSRSNSYSSVSQSSVSNYQAPSGGMFGIPVNMSQVVITQRYHAYHRGLDLASKGRRIGIGIYASAGGRIVTLGWSRYGYGNHIIIDHGNGYQTLYAHLNGFAPGMANGTVVSRGQLIGYMGSTGNSSGPHLHFEIRGAGGARYNPASYIF